MSILSRFSRLLHAGLLATLALGPALAQADEPELTVYKKGKVPLKKPELRLREIPPYSLHSQVFDFPTGLRILMQSDRSHPIVTVHTIYNHGSAHDFPGKEGLAHFVEHTWFKSAHEYVEPITGRTDVIPKMKIMDLQGYIGATMNASTWSDLTDYMTTASSEFKDLLMQYESWRLAEPYAEIEEEEIKVEVNVILNEWRRRNEQNIALLWDYAPMVVFPDDHPYAHSSTKETLDAITFDDIKAYFDKYYRPEETTIVFVGDFDPIEASSLIFRNFDWKLLDPELDPEQDRWVAPKPGITDPDPNNPDHWLVGAFTPESRGKPPAERERYMFKGEIPRRVPEEPDTSEMPKARDGVLVEKAPVEKDLAMAVWALPAGYREDMDALNMVGALANNVLWFALEPYPVKIDYGDDSNLLIFQDYDKFPHLEFAGCGVHPQVLNTLLFCAVEFDATKIDAENAIQKLVDQTPRIWDPSAIAWRRASFQRAKLETMRDTLFNVDQVANPFGGRAQTIGLHLHYTGEPNVHSRKIEAANAIDVEVVTKLAETYMRRDNYGMLHLKPLATSERDVKADGSAYAGAAGEDEVIPDGEGLAEKFTEKDIADAWVKPKLDELEEFKLENGLRVIALRHGEVPLVGATLLIEGGTDMLPENVWPLYANHIRTEMIDVLAIAGGEQMPSGYWGRDVWYLPGFTSSDHEGLMYTAPSPNLDGILYGLRKWATGLQPDMNGFQTWIKKGKDKTEKQLNSPGFHLSMIEREFLYPGHPYSKSMTFSDWDELAKMGKTKVQEMIDGRFRPDRATLIMVGNAPMEAMKRTAYDMFSSWEGKGEPMDVSKPPPASMPTEKSKVVLADNKRRTQSQVRARCRLNYSGPEDREALKVLSSIVGNDVFSTLRVKEGLAYSPGGYAFEAGDGMAILGFSVLATNAGVGRVVEYIQDWVEKHEEEGFSEDTVIAHKLRYARQSGVRAQSIDQLTGVFIRAIEKDVPLSDLLKKGERIAAVAPEQLERLMEGCSDHLIVTIAGPKKVLEPKLKERNIEYEVLEWKDRRDEMFEEQDPDRFAKWQKKDAKDRKKKKKKYSKACAKDPESSACDKLEELLEDEREEKERKKKKKAQQQVAATRR